MGLRKVLGSLRGFTIAGLIRYGLMKVRGKVPIVRGNCNQCGNCCRKLSLDDGHGWIHDIKEFEKIVRKRPEYSCFSVVDIDNSGVLQFRCSHLNTLGECNNYQDRFQFCRDFPDKNLVFCGGGLPPGCGYKICTEQPFDRVLQDTMREKNEKSPDS